jgi:Cof subfamily protein (haloacid dehalogenase superfamily)
MNYDLIVIDVDGTLINSKREITQVTLSALDEVHKREIKVTLATGRNYNATRPFAEAIRASAPLILLNGARVEELGSRRVVASHNLPLRDARRALALVKEMGLHVDLHLDGQIYVERLSQDAIDSMKKDNVTALVVGDLLNFLGRDPTKLLIVGEPKRLNEFKKAYADRWDELPTMVKSEPNYLEILGPGVSKGNALKKVAHYMGIPLAKVMAFGDNPNDLDMIKAAGLGVAMGNAHPELKRVADLIADTNDNDGVAKVIREYIL